MSRLGLSAVQLALDPIRRGEWDEAETFDRLAEAGIAVRSGMFAAEGEDYSTIGSIARTGGLRLDGTWPANLEAAESLAAMCERRGVPLVTFHAGFLPHDPADEERGRMIERLHRVANVFRGVGVTVGLETGQEDATTLLGVLGELAVTGVGVNFDPANMLLYGSGDPIGAFELLADHVVQVHIKDARPSGRPGEWGVEVPAGTGDVAWDQFFDVVSSRVPLVDLMIEREAGDDREKDIARAARLVEEAARERGTA